MHTPNARFSPALCSSEGNQGQNARLVRLQFGKLESNLANCTCHARNCTCNFPYGTCDTPEGMCDSLRWGYNAMDRGGHASDRGAIRGVARDDFSHGKTVASDLRSVILPAA